MEIKDYMYILQHDIHSVLLTTNNEQGHPATAYMDVMHPRKGLGRRELQMRQILSRFPLTGG